MVSLDFEIKVTIYIKAILLQDIHTNVKHMRLTLAELKSRYLSIHLRVQWEMSRQYVLLRGLFPYSGIARHTLVYTNEHKSN